MKDLSSTELPPERMASTSNAEFDRTHSEGLSEVDLIPNGTGTQESISIGHKRKLNEEKSQPRSYVATHSRAQSRELMPPPMTTSHSSAKSTRSREVCQNPKPRNDMSRWRNMPKTQVEVYHNSSWQRPRLIQGDSPPASGNVTGTSNGHQMSGALPSSSSHGHSTPLKRAKPHQDVPSNSVRTKHANSEHDSRGNIPFLERTENSYTENPVPIPRQFLQNDNVEMLDKRRDSDPRQLQREVPSENRLHFHYTQAVPSTPAPHRAQRLGTTPNPSSEPYFQLNGTQLVTPSRQRLGPPNNQRTTYSQHSNRIQPVGSQTIYPKQASHDFTSFAYRLHQDHRGQRASSHADINFGFASSPPFSGQGNGLRAVGSLTSPVVQRDGLRYGQEIRNAFTPTATRLNYVGYLPKAYPSYVPVPPTLRKRERGKSSRSDLPIKGARIGSSYFLPGEQSSGSTKHLLKSFRGIKSGYAFPKDNRIRRDML